MNASALSYPVPPRTALLGLVGNILGLAKDEAPTALSDAAVAVRGKVPRRHYHRANVRKSSPPPCRSGSSRPRRWMPRPMNRVRFVSQVVQEWLLDPDFVVFVGSDRPAGWITDLEARFSAGQEDISHPASDRPG